MLDTRLDEHHAVFGAETKPHQRGVAYPVTFHLDAAGRVDRRDVEEAYRIRESGARIAERVAGARAPSAIAASASTDRARVTASLASPTYFAYQRQDLHVEMDLARGWHVYGPDAPEGTRALAIRVSSTPAGVRAESFEPPPGYEGRVELAVPLLFIVNRGSGEVALDVEVDLQTCSESECLPPTTLALRLRVPEAPVP